MKKSLFGLVLVCGSAQAFDYVVSGSAETFTKWGFDNGVPNVAIGRAPTDSFTTLFSQLNLKTDLGSGFAFGLGGSLAGLVFDSTQGFADDGYSFNASPVQASYFGYSWDKNRVQNYMIQNAYLSYESTHLYLKAGRYQSGKVGEYFSGYNQGAEGYIQSGAFKLWGFWSNGRAFAYNQWFLDFYRVHGLKKDIFATGIDLSFGGFKTSVFSYYVDSKVIAPGVSLTYDTNTDFQLFGFRSLTRVRTLFPQALSSFDGGMSGRDWGVINASSATLWINQHFDVNTFNFGVGIYKNFGNANELIGRYGNPVLSVVDFWTAGAYDIGQSLSDMVAKDAFTGYGYVGATYGAYNWQVLARGTNSLRSAEQSVALNLGYEIREDFQVGGKIEWFSDTTKAGYNPFAGVGVGSPLEENRTDDRSHIFFYATHTF
ncbi:outer membrane family protein [Helicobacter equorum]|uniref:OMP44 n=1 Tax=Helicobacter equorum TaxID=361872 RepID=A0A1M4NH61_9HELI|nr:outer membrane family protein [Helicobacter equorum]SFZ71334.1 OMP44 [Helicobacter equorum]